MAKGSTGGIVYIVGAGPGDPDLITLRGARILESAEVVLYDRLVDPALLERTPPYALRIFVGKRCGRASVTQEEINATMIEHAREGRRVVRLKGGDPFVFGRGAEECLALSGAGIPFEVVPGVSSALAAPAYAGIPLTHRNLAGSFTVISGHLHGGSDPHDWTALASAPTLVVLMGLGSLATISARLTAAGRSPETPAAVVRSGATAMQETVVANLATIARAALGIEPPAVVVIGEVAALASRLEWFEPAALASGPAGVLR